MPSIWRRHAESTSLCFARAMVSVGGFLFHDRSGSSRNPSKAADSNHLWAPAGAPRNPRTMRQMLPGRASHPFCRKDLKVMYILRQQLTLTFGNSPEHYTTGILIMLSIVSCIMYLTASQKKNEYLMDLTTKTRQKNN